MVFEVNNSQVFSALSIEPIRHLEPKNPITLDAQATVDEAIALMQAKKIGAVLILENGQLKGIFTERDVLLKVTNKGLNTSQIKLTELMTSDPETLTENDRIAYALNRMTIGGYRHIPIVNELNELTGIISVKSIVEFLVSLVEKEVYNMQPEPLKAGT